MSKYARYDPDKGRRETWPETVERWAGTCTGAGGGHMGGPPWRGQMGGHLGGNMRGEHVGGTCGGEYAGGTCGGNMGGGHVGGLQLQYIQVMRYIMQYR